MMQCLRYFLDPVVLLYSKIVILLLLDKKYIDKRPLGCAEG